jgi:RND family efflux transporter MFP subunit
MTRTTLRFLSLVALIGLTVAGCQPAEPAVVETGPPPVTVSQPLEKEITDYEQYTGRTEAARTVEVRARVRGELKKVHFEDGALVKAGDPLFDIDPRPYQALLDAAQAKKASAEAQMGLAKSEYDRTRRLIAQGGAASREELEVWTAKRGVAAADIKQAEADIERAKLDLEYASIRAPIAGRISRPLVTEGNLVNAAADDALLTTIVSIDPMYVYFDVDERAALRFQAGKREQRERTQQAQAEGLKQLSIPVSMGLVTDGDRFPYEGVLDFAENKVDPETGTIRVRGVFANTDRRLTPGLFARVRVPVSDKYKALLVNDTAIGTDQGQKYLLVVNAQNKVEYRLVTPGRLEGDLRVFPPDAGLKPGEWVIVNGVQRVRPGIEVKPEQVPMPTRTGAGQSGAGAPKGAGESGPAKKEPGK